MSDDADRTSLEASDWFVRLREAPGDRDLEREFQSWRDAHPDNARAWEEIGAIFALIGDVEPRHPDYLVPRAASAVPAMPAARGRTTARRWRLTAMAAAAACLALLAGPDLLLRLRADHLTAAGQVANVALDDGSQVRLGPDSAIAVAYSSGHRDIRLLKGQAWFEVSPDRSRPFQVRAGAITATALGTAFDVRMIGAESSVAVGHGRVRVEDEAATTARDHVLNPGDWVGIGPDHRATTGHQASDLAGIWRSGSVVIRGRTVAEAIEELRPWFKGRIILADSAIGDKRVTGIFRLADPEEALAALLRPHGGGIVKVTPWLMIVTR